MTFGNQSNTILSGSSPSNQCAGPNTDIGAVEATFLRIERLSQDKVRLHYAGIPGVDYILEATAAFGLPWIGIETNSPGSSGTFQYSDLPSYEPIHLFRVKSP